SEGNDCHCANARHGSGAWQGGSRYGGSVCQSDRGGRGQDGHTLEIAPVADGGYSASSIAELHPAHLHLPLSRAIKKWSGAFSFCAARQVRRAAPNNGNPLFHACGVVRNICSDVAALTTPAFKVSAAPLPPPNAAIVCTS